MMQQALQAVQINNEQEFENRERDRLAALQSFDVLDTPREEDFDRVTRLVKHIFDVEIAIVSMMDAHRQWYKSALGVNQTEVPRHETFCQIPVVTGVPLIVPDARLDPRFADNPHVTSGFGVRFYAGMPLKTPEGHTIGTLCAIDRRPRTFSDRDLTILQDLARVAMGELQLRQRAAIDPLTGVMSRRSFKEDGARAVSLAARHRYRLTCISFDLDFFKSINDRYGHAAGDKVLSGVSNACSALLRQSDLIGRMGGEEFSILLPHTDRQGGLEVAEKLRNAVENLEFEFGGHAVSVTASFGIASIDLAAKDIETLLEHADAALYEAKQAGRNRCVGYGSAEARAKATPRRVLKGGRIVFNNHSSVIECTVRSISEEGAGMDVTTSFGIPQRFTLMIRSDGFEAPCRIVKQTDRHIDVEFC